MRGPTVVVVWDIHTGAEVAKIPFKQELLTYNSPDSDSDGIRRVGALAFDPTGELFAVGGMDGYVQLWNAKSWKREDTLKHDDWVTSLAFSGHDGSVLITGAMDFTAKLWNVTALPAMLLHVLDHGADVLAVAVTGNVTVGLDDGSLAATAGFYVFSNSKLERMFLT